MRNIYAELLMTTVANSHLWHFYSTSYSSHDTLNKFYTELQDIADKYIESDIGANGPIEPSGMPVEYVGFQELVPTLKSFRESTNNMRGYNDKAGNNGLVSILDEISLLVDQTFFRLSRLK